VVVPLGNRSVTGIVVDPAGSLETGQTPPDKIKSILEVLDEEAFLPGDVVDLALWVAEYYACGAGDALAAAVPSTQAHKTIRIAVLTAQGHDQNITTKGRQKEAVELLRGSPGGMTVPDLNVRGISADVLQRLAAKGLIALHHQRIERDPFTSGASVSMAAVSDDRVLTEEQARALDALGAAASTGGFSVFLLQGVTGSGKTEVYLRLADRVLRSGRSVLVLVPEIALTPAVAGAFRDAFGDRVAVQHSGLSDGERSDQWFRIRRGEVSVVVGTRSAVFAPLHQLGLIIVDEEHDSSFKQEETPRYHGRDVAVVRGRNAGALVVLGSATPSLESSHNATNARYTRVVMERRVQDRPLASVSIVGHAPGIRGAWARCHSQRRIEECDFEAVGGGPAVADFVEPPRPGDGGVLPAVRWHHRVPELQRLAHRPLRPPSSSLNSRSGCPELCRRARLRRVSPWRG
jgi:primosomal protein N' (replication factor Y)